MYNERNLRRAEAMMADAFLYRDGGEHSLADLLTPGFFPANQRMSLGDIGLLFARDGTAWVEVVGHDGSDERRPVLKPFATPAAPNVPSDNLKLTRRAA